MRFWAGKRSSVFVAGRLKECADQQNDSAYGRRLHFESLLANSFPSHSL